MKTFLNFIYRNLDAVSIAFVVLFVVLTFVGTNVGCPVIANIFFDAALVSLLLSFMALMCAIGLDN